MQRVAIVGAGAGATMLANALDPSRFEVTVIGAAAEHLFQPGLLYVAFRGASARRLARPERQLLRRSVRFVQARVTRIDLNRHQIITAEGTQFDYDTVVIGTGVVTDRTQIPGLAAWGERIGDYHSTVAEAQKLWRTLEAFGGGTIALGQSTPLIKCPPSPIEGILLTDALLRRRGWRERSRLIFLTPYPRPYPAEAMNAILEPVLRARGIEVRTVFDVDKVDAASGAITSLEGDTIACDLPILIPPFAGAAIAYEPAGTLDNDRLIKTDKTTLRIQGAEHAFALGDATNLPTSKAGVGAHLESKVIARQLNGEAATFSGRTHCPVDLADGRGTFVIGSYAAAVIPCRPTRMRHWMKLAMARIYWISLRGWLEPMFDWYFARTAPEKRAGGAKAESDSV